jgi:hypothetical protein
VFRRRVKLEFEINSTLLNTQNERSEKERERERECERTGVRKEIVEAFVLMGYYAA